MRIRDPHSRATVVAVSALCAERYGPMSSDVSCHEQNLQVMDVRSALRGIEAVTDREFGPAKSTSS